MQEEQCPSIIDTIRPFINPNEKIPMGKNKFKKGVIDGASNAPKADKPSQWPFAYVCRRCQLIVAHATETPTLIGLNVPHDKNLQEHSCGDKLALLPVSDWFYQKLYAKLRVPVREIL